MDFAARHPGKRLLVDESFIDFSGEVSMMDRLRDRPHDNVVVLKSLSKCYAEFASGLAAVPAVEPPSRSSC